MLRLPAHDQRQTWTRDVSRGPSPAAAMNQLQDRSAFGRARIFGTVCHNTTGRGFGPGTLNSHPTTKLGHIPPLFEQRAILLPARGGQLPVRAVIAAPGLSIRATRFQPDPAQSCTNQGLRKLTSGRVHLNRLSSGCSPDGSKTIGKALTNAKQSFASGANAND